MADDGNVRIAIRVPSYAFTIDKKQTKAILRRAGSEVASLAKRKIRTALGAGAKYRGPGGSAKKYRGGYKPGAYQASAAGGAPVSVTGTLEKSIKVRPFKSGEGVAIRDTMFYALFLEKGAKGGGRRKEHGVKVRGKSGIGTKRVLLPRPFLTAAVEDRSKSIGARVQEAVMQGIKFRRMRA